MSRAIVRWMFFAILSACLGLTAMAQTTAYQQTNLVADTAGTATHTDTALVNPWGLAFQPGAPFWLAANNSGISKVYDANGVSQSPTTVTIPPPTGQTASSTPTSVIYNATGLFQIHGAPTQFLFATEDGTISGWYSANGSNAVLGLDHSTQLAVYKGMALLTPSCCAPFLAVANFHSGLVETYDGSFSAVAPPGSFTDPNLPAGYAPFNVQPIGNQVFVTYAVQDSAKHDPVKAAGNGIVSVFNSDGTFVKRFVSNGALNAPWGVVQASASFGQFSNDILIGNFGDGAINVFDSGGNSLGQLKDSTGAAIMNSGLWAMVFGSGGTGDPNTLYFTAGLNDEQHGLFGTIAVAQANGAADFSVSASPTSATVKSGSSANFTITAAPVAGFAGTVSFTCTAPSGITCQFTPTSVTLSGAMGTTQLVATAAPITGGGGGGYTRPMGMFLMLGAGVFGTMVVNRRKLSAAQFRCASVVALLALLLALAGCGSYSSSNTMRPPASIVVNAQSGSVSHTTTLTLTVN